MLFLLFGLYLIFPASQQMMQVSSEKSEPYELMAVASESEIYLDRILAIEGVDRVGPVIHLDGAMEYGKDSPYSCQVRAVYSSYLELDFKEGNCFSDNSNMPFLILNTAAAEDLTATVNTEVLLNGHKSVICGIFDDGNEFAAAYMSYDTASRFFPQTGQTELLISLQGKGYSSDVAKELQKQGLSAAFDENLQLRWELQTQQGWLFLLTAVGFLTCAGSLIAANRRRELEIQYGETCGLLLAGFMPKEVRWIFPLRIAFAVLLNLALVSIIAWIIEIFNQ